MTGTLVSKGQNPAYRPSAFMFLFNQEPMQFSYRQLEFFFTQKIWYIDESDLSPVRRYVFRMMKKLVLTIECYFRRNINSYASALTFSSILAIVPILAIIFAIGRGFGYGTIIENEIKRNLSVNQGFADLIFDFIGSYLDHTKSGFFIGFGLLLLLYTIIQLTSNIEIALNEIWQVKNQRSIYRQITDYISVFLLLPILIIISSGLSIFLATVAQHFPNFMVLSTTVQLLLHLLPYVISSLLFIGLYCYMPNTRVQVRHAFFPGILAGVLFQLLQYFYIHSQIWVSTYNAIYGSFAALPMFMLWVNFSWIICLFGAQLTYANQNLKSYPYLKDIHRVSRHYHDVLLIMILSRICKRFEKDMIPYSLYGLSAETSLPVGVIGKLIHELHKMNLIVVEGDDMEATQRVVPSADIHRLTVNEVMARIDAYGDFYTGKAAMNWLHPEWDKLLDIRKSCNFENGDVLLKDL